MDRQFQPFQRLGTIRANHSNGHGLGLSIVRAIATAHGAVLTVHARPEGGLHIGVTFPATDRPADDHQRNLDRGDTRFVPAE